MLLAGLGFRVLAVDRDAGAVCALRGVPGIEVRVADLEAGAWPLAAERFDAIVVANYLHRPSFPHLLRALNPDGLLIYETFAAGNERFGRPSNPDFLLRHGELLEVVRGRMRVLAYENLEVDAPKPAMVQRLCASMTQAGE
jgi:SAM-dependent methyltransferase